MNHEVYIIDDGGTLTATVKEIFQDEDTFRIKHATPKNYVLKLCQMKIIILRHWSLLHQIMIKNIELKY